MESSGWSRGREASQPRPTHYLWKKGKVRINVNVTGKTEEMKTLPVDQ
jgi:hypothetical protein